MSAFINALTTGAFPVIAELKPRSAAGEELVGTRAPADIARAYLDAGAACLSVVTGRWFGGDPAMLAEITRLSPVPVLRKDFLTRDKQLVASLELGASAVLLTATLLPAAVLATLVGRALALGLTPFVEVVDEAEIERVPNAADCVIAVNNKDIRDRERGPADLGRSTRLLSPALARGTRCPVSASGIETPEQAARLIDAGYAGVLVGTGLLRAHSPAHWFADLAAARKERL
ncbi:indole-3-glycerol phosphate synthase [Actinokineospora alba]|uniref:indole-3-glycerol-phosphate synthase n=1 Tax=Actinokineospora alba TaxID=504798 RepID=A0A1H0R665_9PSEU|nr:indole-3-glycerol-phosphate synthase [Actinokineospora alba]TDP70231.1 indole-3-glycerol phosphate synthase [Actinokineospora alba]SDI36204.1 indole-3-glycerol phosphate synthase [Actinokineospora alba]SDP24991.1 indole-3-glycerol phosphate synthase [Actinokineospora alba]